MQQKFKNRLFQTFVFFDQIEYIKQSFLLVSFHNFNRCQIQIQGKYNQLQAMANRYLRSSCQGLKKSYNSDNRHQKSYLYPKKSQRVLTAQGKMNINELKLNTNHQFPIQKSIKHQSISNLNKSQIINEKKEIIIFKKNSFNKVKQQIKNLKSQRIKYFNSSYFEQNANRQNMKSETIAQEDYQLFYEENFRTKQENEDKNIEATLSSSCCFQSSTNRETCREMPKKKLSLTKYSIQNQNRNKHCFSYAKNIQKKQIKATQSKSQSLLNLLLGESKRSSYRMRSTMTRILSTNPQLLVISLQKKTQAQKDKNIASNKPKQRQCVLSKNNCLIRVQGFGIKLSNPERQYTSQSIKNQQ